MLQGLQPNYYSIADFRKVNATALQNLFKLFVSFLKDAGLIGGIIIAVDGTKIQRHLDYIEQKSKVLLEEFERTDAAEDEAIRLGDVPEKLARLQEHKIKYEALQSRLDQTNEPQVSTTDPDARALLVRGVVVEVGYNVQAAVMHNKQNYKSNFPLYRQRQEINEHIFGTFKRQWNLYYTNLCCLEKVNGELSLIMLVYNMKRARNILGHSYLLEKLSNWTPKYPGDTYFV